MKKTGSTTEIDSQVFNDPDKTEEQRKKAIEEALNKGKL
jgi:hypothetical protein